MTGKEGDGAIYMISFKPFKPYKVDVNYYQEVRKEFTLSEWIDMLLLAVDYNPVGFLDTAKSLPSSAGFFHL